MPQDLSWNFCENWQLILKFIWKYEAQNTQGKFEEQKKWETSIIDIKVYC